MTTPLPQSPPDPPVPPPDATGLRLRRKARRIWWLGGISIFVCLGIVLPGWVTISGQRAKADLHEAYANMRCVGCMLVEFDTEYASYPNASTAADVKAATSTTLTLGTATSNQLFRQMLAGGGGKSEKPFWAKTAISPKKPDDDFSSDATAFAKGECGFTYVAGLDASSAPDAPVLLCPMIPGSLTFDPEPFRGKAVILTVDNAAHIYDIDQHGRVIVNGMDVFDPKQAFWKGKTPDVKWPE